MNLQVQALQILKNDDEVENLSLSSFLLAVQGIWPAQPSINQNFHVMSCFVFYISVSGPNCWNKEPSVDLLSVKLTFAIPVSTLVLSLTTLANHWGFILLTVSHIDTSTAQWCILTKVRPMIAYSNLLNKAVTHLVLNHLIPRLPVPNFLSPWTNDPHKIYPTGQMVPNLFCPPGQMEPNQFSPCISGSPQPVPLNKWNIIGTICLGWPNYWRPWVHRYLIGWASVCPEGPINWGPNVGDHMYFGPNVSKPVQSCRRNNCEIA